MADKLDGLIEWLVDEVVYSGDDGISFSNLLARVGAFYSDADKPTRSTNDENENADQNKSIINDDFNAEIWKRLVGHQDVIVGESAPLDGLKPFHDAAATELSTSYYGGGAFAQGHNHDYSSPSAQLLDQTQAPPIHESATGEDGGVLAPAQLTQNNTNAMDEDSVSSAPEDEVDLIVFNENPTQDALSFCDDGPQDQKQISSHLDAFKPEPRIYASMTRKWMTIAGQRPESARLGNSVWQCLYAIAQARGSGISQQHLHLTSGHDETALSVQLDQLVKDGYVIRGQSAAEDGLESNLFILKKFSDEITSPSSEAVIHEDTMMSDETQFLLQEDGMAAKAIAPVEEMVKEDTPRPQSVRGRGRPRTRGDPPSRPVPFKETRGRPRISQATYTSYDQSQRAKGLPGVYRDIPQFTDQKQNTRGRPRKRLRLLFKSENLKRLAWFHKESEVDPNVAINPQESSPIKSNLSTKRRRHVEVDESDNGPPQKRILIDMVSDFGGRIATPNQTPYQPTTPSAYTSPNSALYLTQSTFPPPSLALPETPAPSDQSIATGATFTSSFPRSVQRRPSDFSVVIETRKGPKTRSKAAAITSQAPMSVESLQLVQTAAAVLALAVPDSPGKEAPQTSFEAQVTDQMVPATGPVATEERQAVPASCSAGNIEPRCFSSLSTKMDGIAGILYLSTDRQSLTFSAHGGKPDAAEIKIQISDIKEPPQNIATDSSTMELCITTTNDDEESTSYSFLYLATEAENGNIMRANIVTAMLILDLDDESTESLQEDERAFKCDQCGGSWKNWEGIKYHRTRSRTACNPNFDHGKRTRKKSVRQPKRSVVKAPKNDTNNDGIVAEESPSALDMPASQPLAIIAKAAQVDINRPTNVVKTPRPQSPHQMSKEIIMALLDAHDGCFPGECSLWDAHIATWVHANFASSMPDQSNWDAILNSLVDSGHFRSLQFSFKDEWGLMRLRTIITQNDIDPTSTMVNELKELIKAAFPGHYNPTLVTLPKVIQSIQKAREERNNTSASQNRRVTRSGRISKPVSRLLNSQDDFLLYSAGQEIFDIPQPLDNKVDSDKEYEESLDGSNSLVDTPVGDSDSDSDYSTSKKRGRLQRPAMTDVDQHLIWQPAEDPHQKTPRKLPQIQIEQDPTRVKKKYSRTKPQLPEPVTFMQTLNSSAWAFRPYGHGVRPIQARPSSRVSKNGAYLEKIEQGFRPVIMPTNRDYGPVLRSNSSYEAEAIEFPSLEGSRLKHMRSPSSVIDDHYENSVPQKKRRGRPPKTTVRHSPFPWSGLGSAGALNFGFPSTTSTPHPNSLHPSANSSLGLGIFDETVRDDFHRRLLPRAEIISSHSASQAEPSARLGDDHGTCGIDSSRLTARPFINMGVGNNAGHWDENHSTLGTPELGSNEDGNISAKANDPTQERLVKKKQKVREPSILTTRRLTALPGDITSVQSAMAAYPDLNVQVALEHPQNNIRMRNKGPALSREMENRLKVAVVVIRSLTGGLDKQIDWVLISKIFPQFPLSALLLYWPPIASQHKQNIGKLEKLFEEFFIQAYTEGLVPPINYDNLVAYDWGQLVDLVVKRVVIEGDKTELSLPASRSELGESYDVKEESKRPWRDDFFHHHIAVYKRIEFSSSEHLTLPAKADHRPQQVVDGPVIARSWARANTLTPKNSFDPNFAKLKLSSLPHGLLKTATKELITRKIINHRNRGRPVPGRGFEPSDGLDVPFRKTLNERHLSVAYAFKTSLDKAFLLGETVKVDWAANDGEILVMTNLQAYGRIDLVPGDNVPMNRFGLTDGDYQTKRMEKSKLRFDIEIRPTSSYLYNLQLPVLSKAPLCLSHPDPAEVSRPPYGTHIAIPVWYDIGGYVITDMWKKALSTVLGIVALRPGIGIKELGRLFAPALEEWEIRILMEWGCMVGAVVDVREEGKGMEWRDGSRDDESGKPNEDEKGHERVSKLDGAEGWSTGEWWWAIAGRDW